MTRERTKKLLPVMQAFAEGKEIEYKQGEDEWYSSANPTWDVGHYRIKPRTIWVNEYHGSYFFAYTSKDSADADASKSRIACHEITIP